MFNRCTCNLFNACTKQKADETDVQPYEDKNGSNGHKITGETTPLRTGKRSTVYPGQISQQITANDRHSVPGPVSGNNYETEETDVKRPIPTDDEYPFHLDCDSRTSKEIQKSQIRELEEHITLLHGELQTVKEERDEALSRQSDSVMGHKIQTLEEQMEQLKQEKDEILTRLSEYTSKAVADNNPNIADLGDINRPTKLVERFSELYDNEWTEAFEYLQKTGPTNRSEEAAVKAIKTLLKVLQKIYELCKAEAAFQLQKTVESIYGLTRLETSCGPIKRSLKEFKDERKQNYLAFLPDLNKKVENMDEIWAYCSRDVSEYTLYISKATEICWLMSIQDPSMELRFSGRNRKEFDGELFRAYTETGKKIAFVVWPAVLLNENGSTLMKGVAQGKTKKKDSLIKHAKKRKSNVVHTCSTETKEISENNRDATVQDLTIDDMVTEDESHIGSKDIGADKDAEERNEAIDVISASSVKQGDVDLDDDDDDVIFNNSQAVKDASVPHFGNTELVNDKLDTLDLNKLDNRKMNSLDKMMRGSVKQAFQA